ncbi:GntR family transcriptional regulator [Desulfuribacillus alkaliarsenatis]|uniref:GntR family transcriptional regulator n=1 Tax=Desulfuribacillus alkaliarsenatis TaxID=766136 RepID=A0A1E5G130_9FIRM|nr:GntR family transcriptional regulator [Desulfuribacillus alkaliarsenatis]OEF96616.1 GntR family transcriptional regulator [Desulfuribacillus alkaliarsenatis]
MILNTEGLEPIYVQIANWLETEILRGNLKDDEKVYSQYQLADMFNINPATAAKGLTMLAEEEILYKKRGLGMFVSPNAKKQIRNKRIEKTLKQLVSDIVVEAKRLEVSEEELISMIKNINNNGGA